MSRGSYCDETVVDDRHQPRLVLVNGCLCWAVRSDRYDTSANLAVLNDRHQQQTRKAVAGSDRHI